MRFISLIFLQYTLKQKPSRGRFHRFRWNLIDLYSFHYNTMSRRRNSCTKIFQIWIPVQHRTVWYQFCKKVEIFKIPKIQNGLIADHWSTLYSIKWEFFSTILRHSNLLKWISKFYMVAVSLFRILGICETGSLQPIVTHFRASNVSFSLFNDIFCRNGFRRFTWIQ